MDSVPVLLLAACVGLAASGIVVWCCRRFEVGVFLLVLSPWVSAVFVSNLDTTDVDLDRTTAGSYLRIGLLVMLGIVGAIQFMRSRHSGRGISLPMKLLGIFLLLSLISASYSANPSTTLIRTTSGMAVFLFLIGLDSWLVNKERLDKTITAILFMIVLMTIINALALVLWPGKAWAFEASRFQGLSGQPNSMGSFCMTAYPVLIWKYMRSLSSQKYLIILTAVVVGTLHLLTGSRGSFVGAVVGLCVWCLVKRDVARLLLILAIAALAAGYVLEFRRGALQREETDVTALSGRPEFWTASYELLMERPLLGYGYGVEGSVFRDWRFFDEQSQMWMASMPLHNGYLTVAMGGGVISFLIWFAAVLIPFCWLGASGPSDYKALVMSMASMLLLCNFIESVVTGPSGSGMLFWWAWVVAGKFGQPWMDEHLGAVVAPAIGASNEGSSL